MKKRDATDTSRMNSRAHGNGSEVSPLGHFGDPGGFEHRPARRSVRWISWILAFAMVAAVIIAALHFSEERELVRVAERAQPWWLAIALMLQVGTYFAQGEIWRTVMRASGVNLPLLRAFKLSLTKLFIDQALPSGGISGTVVVASALEARRFSRDVVMTAMVVDTVAYYVAFVLALALALFILMAGGHANLLILAAAFFFWCSASFWSQPSSPSRGETTQDPAGSGAFR